MGCLVKYEIYGILSTDNEDKRGQNAISREVVRGCVANLCLELTDEETT